MGPVIETKETTCEGGKTIGMLNLNLNFPTEMKKGYVAACSWQSDNEHHTSRQSPDEGSPPSGKPSIEKNKM